jgi:hypothetical protein
VTREGLLDFLGDIRGIDRRKLFAVQKALLLDGPGVKISLVMDRIPTHGTTSNPGLFILAYMADGALPADP